MTMRKRDLIQLFQLFGEHWRRLLDGDHPIDKEVNPEDFEQFNQYDVTPVDTDASWETIEDATLALAEDLSEIYSHESSTNHSPDTGHSIEEMTMPDSDEINTTTIDEFV